MLSRFTMLTENENVHSGDVVDPSRVVSEGGDRGEHEEDNGGDQRDGGKGIEGFDRAVRIVVGLREDLVHDDDLGALHDLRDDLDDDTGDGVMDITRDGQRGEDTDEGEVDNVTECQDLEASEAGTDEDHDDVGLFHDLEKCDRTVVVRDVGQHERSILNKMIY